MTDQNDRWWEALGASAPGPAADPHEQTSMYPGGQPPAGMYPGGQPPAGSPYAPPAGGYTAAPGYPAPHQYSAPPNYGGQQPLPGYGYGLPPRRNRTGPIIAIVLAAVVLIGGAITAVVVTHRSSSTTTAAATTSRASATTTTAAPTHAVTPGFQAVVVPSYGIAYDVPSGWSVSSVSARDYYYGAGGGMVGVGQATDGEHYCPGSKYRTEALVTSVDSTDTRQAAIAVAKLVAEGGYSDSSGGGLQPAVAATTSSGLRGQRVQTSGPWTPKEPGCTANAYTVYTFAFNGPQDRLLVLTILSDRGTDGELTAAQAQQIIASVRAI